MAYDQLSTYQTQIVREDNNHQVIYRGTRIVHWTYDTITLKDGGWQSVTTKRKMNQAANQFGLGYQVFQKAHVWYVTTPQGETVTYEDGMTFPRFRLEQEPSLLSP